MTIPLGCYFSVLQENPWLPPYRMCISCDVVIDLTSELSGCFYLGNGEPGWKRSCIIPGALRSKNKTAAYSRSGAISLLGLSFLQLHEKVVWKDSGHYDISLPGSSQTFLCVFQVFLVYDFLCFYRFGYSAGSGDCTDVRHQMHKRRIYQWPRTGGQWLPCRNCGEKSLHLLPLLTAGATLKVKKF